VLAGRQVGRGPEGAELLERRHESLRDGAFRVACEPFAIGGGPGRPTRFFVGLEKRTPPWGVDDLLVWLSPAPVPSGLWIRHTHAHAFGEQLDGLVHIPRERPEARVPVFVVSLVREGERVADFVGRLDAAPLIDGKEVETKGMAIDGILVLVPEEVVAQR